MANTIQVSEQSRDSLIRNLLESPEGNVRLGQVISKSIKLDNLARQNLLIDVLQKDSPAIYDNFDRKVLIINAEGITNSFSHNRILVPMFQIRSGINFGNLRIQGNRSFLLDKFVEDLNESFNELEETNFLDCLRNIITGEFEYKYISNLFHVNPHDYSVILSLDNAKWLESKFKMHVSEFEMSSIKDFFPLKIVSSKYCKDNEIFIIPSETKIGVIPTYGSLESYASTDSATGYTNFNFAETIGMVINRPELIVKFSKDEIKKLSNHNKRYAFVSGGSGNIERIKEKEENRNPDLENKINRELIKRLDI